MFTSLLWGHAHISTPKAKILIIDDDPDINNLFKRYLEHDNYKIDTYTNPLDALYYYKKGRWFDSTWFENATNRWYCNVSGIKENWWGG